MSLLRDQPDRGRALKLHATTRGQGPTVVLVHGFTQTGASWARVAGALETDFEVVLPDLPGHGLSPLPNSGLGLEQTAVALGDAGGRACYVGYSLGGRCCLRLALDAPELVDRLAIIGAHPGIYEAPERLLRREEDARLAARLEKGGDAFVPEFIESWLAGPLFAHLTEEQADRPHRLVNSAAGLAASLRNTGTGMQAPVWDRLGELEMPVLVIVGERDDKFRPIAERSAESIGRNARLAVVAGAGHAVAFERPDAFVALIREFLAADRWP